MALYKFTSSTTLNLTSSKSVLIECFGAGGRGSKTGNGGSGGAYSAVTKTLGSGSYLIGVGKNDYNGYGNGGDTWFKSGSLDVIICQAGGGNQDGTITHQITYATGSTKYYGGTGCPDYTGYASYNGSGGGGGAGNGGNGQDGQSAFFSTTVSASLGGTGSWINGDGTGNGGNGGFYYAGANVNGVFQPETGSYPGGGGGGAYDYGAETEAAGGDGVLYLTY
jgi:hypothetical protein